MQATVQILKALAESNRLRMVMMLRERPLCVCEICAVLDISVSTISAHLRQLSHAGLVEGHKEGRWVTYELRADEATQGLLEWLAARLAVEPLVAADRRAVRNADRESCAAQLRSAAVGGEKR